MTPFVRRSVTALVIALTVGCSLVAGLALRVLLESRRPFRGGAEYVALGSSFASGPGVAERAAGSPSLCMRSSSNYPQLFAHRRGMDLTDVTCAGATIRDVLKGGRYFLGPQVDALQPHTRLVTVTVGGNDVAYLRNLSAWSCDRARNAVPLLWRRVACTVVPDHQVDAALKALPAQLTDLVQEIHDRAPHALVVLVDYITVLPESAACIERLPLTDSELAKGRGVAARLADITEAVASATGALLVRASDLTRDHDVCSADPWVFGFTFPRTPFAFGPLFYHPTEMAMAVISGALDRVVPAPLTRDCDAGTIAPRCTAGSVRGRTSVSSCRAVRSARRCGPSVAHKRAAYTWHVRPARVKPLQDNEGGLG
jgi:lysophospholipase L1-like esterase